MEPTWFSFKGSDCPSISCYFGDGLNLFSKGKETRWPISRYDWSEDILQRPHLERETERPRTIRPLTSYRCTATCLIPYISGTAFKTCGSFPENPGGWEEREPALWSVTNCWKRDGCWLVTDGRWFNNRSLLLRFLFLLVAPGLWTSFGKGMFGFVGAGLSSSHFLSLFSFDGTYDKNPNKEDVQRWEVTLDQM